MKKESRKLVGFLFSFLPCLCPFSIGAELRWCIFFSQKNKKIKKRKEIKKGIEKKNVFGVLVTAGQPPHVLFFFFFFFFLFCIISK
jgi:hypothetical protein